MALILKMSQGQHIKQIEQSNIIFDGFELIGIFFEKSAQCENLTIFLPLRFYVKSIICSHIVAFLTTSAVLNFEFLGLFDIYKCKIAKLKIQNPQNG